MSSSVVIPELNGTLHDLVIADIKKLIPTTSDGEIFKKKIIEQYAREINPEAFAQFDALGENKVEEYEQMKISVREAQSQITREAVQYASELVKSNDISWDEAKERLPQHLSIQRQENLFEEMYPGKKEEYEKYRQIKEKLEYARVDGYKRFDGHLGALSDAFGAVHLVDGGLGIGHRKGYYEGLKSSAAGSEFFAEAFSAHTVNKQAYEEIKKYMPNAIKAFEYLLSKRKEEYASNK
ncbi:MAG: hypothetical protein EOM74_01045 [Methanomicrobia archaeon]|nr:hypothetical protein [Methanomicrobia archaeon]